MSDALTRLKAVLEGRYRIERELGAGGMATVYLAHDLRHGRRVAIKLLRTDLAETLGPDRFTREIEIAAGLTHPHILPLHDSGIEKGLLYYVMPFVQGESLRDRLETEGPLPVPDAARIFREIVDALGAAHAQGVIHRDVKPGNILLSGGHALVADFGVAKALSEATGVRKLTSVGVALGTPEYMAPEQAGADPATDHRADLFAAGVIAYEMLTGASPFRAPTTPAVFAALMTKTPEHPSRLREAVPGPLGDIVLWCLEKEPSARPQDAAQLLGRLDAALTPPAGSVPAGTQGRRGRGLWSRGRIAAALTLLVVASLGAWRVLARRAELRWARQEALPEVIRVLGESRTREAAELALRVERVLGADPVLEPLWPRMTATLRAVTEPAGADVWYRPYTSADTTWARLGTTPYESQRFPAGAFRFRVELDGYEPVEEARTLIPADWAALLDRSGIHYLTDPSYALDLTLAPAGSGPPGMIHVAGGIFMTVPVSGFETVSQVDIPAFWIDRTEVTNAAYLEFVEAGAYSDSTLWTEPFRRSGARVPWSAAMAEMVDGTGRPGPSTWVLGRPPENRGSFPVGGVSWYEASAYCAWRGKSLPTLYHWARAAVPSADPWVPFHPILAAASNFQSDGPVAVGALDAIGTSGAQDLAGNVREWVSTPSGEYRHFAGGSWDEPEYVIHDQVLASPWVRLPTDGFRCASYPDGALPERLLGSIELPPQDLSQFTAMPDAVFEASSSLYAYDRSRPLAAHVDSTLTSSTGGTVEWVSVDAPYGGRLPIRLHLPKEGTPPYGAVIFFPASDLLFSRDIGEPHLSFLPRAGWVLVEPIFDGGYQRNDGRTLQRLQSPASRAELHSHWVQDLGRAIDYLEQRPDVDGAAVAYAGLSLGASMAPELLPHEPRVRAAMLYSGGFSPRSSQESLNRSASLAGRLRLPLLMIGGRNDFSVPVGHQEALFRAFGTPEEDKRLRVYDGAHWPLPMNEVIRETVDFLDRYSAPGATAEAGRQP